MSIRKDSDSIALIYEGFWNRNKSPQEAPQQKSQKLDHYGNPVSNASDMQDGQLHASTKSMPQKPYNVKLLLTKKGWQEAPKVQIWPRESANQYRGQSGHKVGQGFTFLGDEVDAALESGQWVLASGGNPKVPATQEEIDYRSKLPKKWSSEFDD